MTTDTSVKFYWGGTDGGTTAGNWANVVDLGTPTRGSVSTNIAGLATKTTYYYRLQASNAAGTVWASSSRSFTTAGGPR